MGWVDIKELPELISAYSREDHYFGVIRKIFEDSDHKYEFGITSQGFKDLKKIFQFRPFETMPGIQYRYFFQESFKNKEDVQPSSLLARLFRRTKEVVRFHVRLIIVQGSNQKNFEFAVSQELAATLQWFREVNKYEELSHLNIVD